MFQYLFVDPTEQHTAASLSHQAKLKFSFIAQMNAYFSPPKSDIYLTPDSAAADWCYSWIL